MVLYDRLGNRILAGALLFRPIYGTMVVVTRLDEDWSHTTIWGIVLEGNYSWYFAGREGVYGRRVPGVVGDYEIVGCRNQ